LEPDEPQRPTASRLLEARDEFRALLDEAESTEDAWQRFFAANPFVLSMSLPLRLRPEDIVPLGRRGRTEPDFVFYPRHLDPAPFYGVIELKRPSTRIATRVRVNTAVLSRDAATAIGQAEAYAQRLTDHIPHLSPTMPLFVGNRLHAFVILGLSEELSTKLGVDLTLSSIAGGLPPGFQLIPFDTLLQMFESELPPSIHVLVPIGLPSDPGPSARDVIERLLVKQGPPIYAMTGLIRRMEEFRELEARGSVFVESAEDVPEGAILVVRTASEDLQIARKRGLHPFEARPV
jgi:hypothetical protein